MILKTNINVNIGAKIMAEINYKHWYNFHKTYAFFTSNLSSHMHNIDFTMSRVPNFSDHSDARRTSKILPHYCPNSVLAVQGCSLFHIRLLKISS